VTTSITQCSRTTPQSPGLEARKMASATKAALAQGTGRSEPMNGTVRLVTDRSERRVGPFLRVVRIPVVNGHDGLSAGVLRHRGIGLCPGDLLQIGR
jgi:hypothetical protein